jgi:hypothetical protein
VTCPDAFTAEDAQVVVSDNERILHLDGESSVIVRIGHFAYAYEVNRFLQFAASVFGTEDALLLVNAGQAQTYVTGFASFSAVTGEADMGMPCQQYVQHLAALFVDFRGVAINNHAVGSRFAACGNETASLL